MNLINKRKNMSKKTKRKIIKTVRIFTIVLMIVNVWAKLCVRYTPYTDAIRKISPVHITLFDGVIIFITCYSILNALVYLFNKNLYRLEKFYFAFLLLLVVLLFSAIYPKASYINYGFDNTIHNLFLPVFITGRYNHLIQITHYYIFLLLFLTLYGFLNTRKEIKKSH